MYASMAIIATPHTTIPAEMAHKLGVISCPNNIQDLLMPIILFKLPSGVPAPGVVPQNRVYPGISRSVAVPATGVDQQEGGDMQAHLVDA